MVRDGLAGCRSLFHQFLKPAEQRMIGQFGRVFQIAPQLDAAYESGEQVGQMQLCERQYETVDQPSQRDADRHEHDLVDGPPCLRAFEGPASPLSSGADAARYDAVTKSMQTKASAQQTSVWTGASRPTSAVSRTVSCFMAGRRVG